MREQHERTEGTIVAVDRERFFAHVDDIRGQRYFLYGHHLDSFGPQLRELHVGWRVSFLPIEDERPGRWRAIEARVVARD